MRVTRRVIPALAVALLSMPAGAEPGAAVARRAPKVIAVVPLGGPDAAVVQMAAEALRARFRMEVRIAASVPMPASAWYAPRRRWRAEKILRFLDGLDPGADLVAGVTEQPISTTKGPYRDWGIAGLGDIGGRSSVSSVFYYRRFKGAQPATHRRFSENIVLHEVGHTLGLEHCPLTRCIMADARGNAVRAATESSGEYCPRCHERVLPLLRDPQRAGLWSEHERALLEGREHFAPLPEGGLP